MKKDLGDLTDLEIDLLLLFYSLSDQFGKVDMRYARRLAWEKLSVEIPNQQIYIKQMHVDALVKYGLLPDIGEILEKMKVSPKRSIKQRKRSPKQ